MNWSTLWRRNLLRVVTNDEQPLVGLRLRADRDRVEGVKPHFPTLAGRRRARESARID